MEIESPKKTACAGKLAPKGPMYVSNIVIGDMQSALESDVTTRNTLPSNTRSD